MKDNTPSTIEKVVALYGEGGSDVEVARLLGLSMRKFNELIDENEKFAEVVERGRTLSQAWWYEMGRKGLTMDKFNGPLFGMNMKNRFAWADKVETGDKAGSMPMNQDEAAAQLRAALKRISKSNPDLLRIAMDTE